MKSKKLISIVIPIYNESLGIPELVKQLTKFIDKKKFYDFEIIFVEHGSADRSFAILSLSTLAVLSITLLEAKPMPYIYGREYNIFLLSGITIPLMRGMR